MNDGNDAAKPVQNGEAEGEGIRRALSTPISEMINTATGYLYAAGNNNQNRNRAPSGSGSSRSTPRNSY